MDDSIIDTLNAGDVLRCVTSAYPGEDRAILCVEGKGEALRVIWDADNFSMRVQLRECWQLSRRAVHIPATPRPQFEWVGAMLPAPAPATPRSQHATITCVLPAPGTQPYLSTREELIAAERDTARNELADVKRDYAALRVQFERAKEHHDLTIAKIRADIRDYEKAVQQRDEARSAAEKLRKERASHWASEVRGLVCDAGWED